MLEIVSGILRGGLLAAGLILPGLTWAHAVRCPLPWFAGGVLSALAILAAVLCLDLLGFPINLWTLSIWLAGVTLGGWGWGRWRRAGPLRFCLPDAAGWWWALPALPSVGVAVWRAVVQPLSGADVDFRWGHLARLVVEKGSLDFYPPVAAEDFSLYFWADGIAPLISGVYAWTYFCAGTVDEIWTAIPVLLQFAGLYALLFALGRSWAGPAAGWMACGFGGATMLLQFAFGLGQETGMTALGAAGMAFYCVKLSDDRTNGSILAAAACAGLVACAREYGMAFIVVGAVWVLRTTRSIRAASLFVAVAGVLPVYWHARNWIVTGNPLYAHDVAGLFPTNPVFDAWMRGYVEIYGSVLSRGSGWRELARYSLIGALPALAGLLGAAIAGRRLLGWADVVVVVTVTCAVWATSIPFTAGGLFYSMRVLSPALLLGCAFAGAVAVRHKPSSLVSAGALVALFAWGVDAALRSLTVPQNPYNLSPQEWIHAGDVIRTDARVRDSRFLDNVSDIVSENLLSDSAGLQVELRNRDVTLKPLWSPDVIELFDVGTHDLSALLLRNGYSHILLKRSQYTADFLRNHGVISRLANSLQAVAENENYILFVIRPEENGAN